MHKNDVCEILVSFFKVASSIQQVGGVLVAIPYTQMKLQVAFILLGMFETLAQLGKTYNPTPTRFHPTQLPSEEISNSRSSTDSHTLTSTEVETIKAAIVKKFDLQPSYGDECNAKVKACSMGDNMGAILRLGFHDASGYSGPNGCIDFTNPDNNGLQEIVSQLDDLYLENNWDQTISKADLYVLASNLVIHYATTQSSHVNQKGLLAISSVKNFNECQRCVQVGSPPPLLGTVHIPLKYHSNMVVSISNIATTRGIFSKQAIPSMK